LGQVSGKVAIVTGGASGIGEACAETLAREGAAVVVADVDDALGKNVVERIKKAGGKASHVHLDVRDEAAWPGVIAESEKRFGRLDIMVANAGIGIAGPLIDRPTGSANRRSISMASSSPSSMRHPP